MIVAPGIVATLAAKAATTTIPIIFYTGVDPVASGLVASLNRPGGNLTGSAILSTELGPKRLQLLRESVPDAVLFAVLGNASAELQAAARTPGLQLVVANSQTDSELGPGSRPSLALPAAHIYLVLSDMKCASDEGYLELEPLANLGAACMSRRRQGPAPRTSVAGAHGVASCARLSRLGYLHRRPPPTSCRGDAAGLKGARWPAGS